MKKLVSTIIKLLVFLVIIPVIAGFGITALWNCIIPTVCGFAAISFWQGIGLFLLGQLLSGGFVLGIILMGGILHLVSHHSHGELAAHWHNMSDEQRREFIERRRREHFMFHMHTRRAGDDAE